MDKVDKDRSDKDKIKKKEKTSNITFILGKTKKHTGKVVFACIFSVLASLCKLSPYILMQNILSSLIDKTPNNSLIFELVTWTCVLIVLNIIFTMLALGASHIAAFSVLYELRIKTIEHLGRLNLGFFRHHSSGQIKKALDEDIEKLELFIAHQIPDLAESIITPLVIFVYLLTLKWYLALCLLVPFILVALAQTWMFKDYEKNVNMYNELKNRLHTTIVEYVHGIKIFKAFNLTAKTFKNYVNVVNEYLSLWVGMCNSSIKAYSIGICIIDSATFLIIIPLGGFLFLQNHLIGADFLMFLLLGSVFLTGFVKLAMLGESLSMLLKGAENVRKILETKEQKSDGLELSKEDAQKDIEFRNVNFKYEEQYVVKNLELTLKKGSVTALVGPSGSGKTTLGLLLGRFYDVEEGGIFIGEKNINDYTLESLLSQTSFVFQDVFILNDTVFNNVNLGLGKTKEEVIKACKKAQIHTFIESLKDGYDTVIGEGSGIKLSGGEMQRLSIARAFLKDAPIVVLDEVTSYSDIENEKEIQKALQTLLKDKTAIIIAHRLYTIKNADNIVVLNEGKIAEKGKHDELLAKDGIYKRMWEHEIA